MTKHRKDPYRRVVTAELHDDELGRFWFLVLECGHEDTRGVAYVKSPDSKWGGRRQDGCTRSVKDLRPAPTKVRCEQCGG
jgi:hypothetical protein